MTLGRAMVKGSLWASLDGFASEIANLSIFLVLVRLLGPAEYGIVALAMVFVGTTTDLVGHSISRVLIQRPDLTDRLCQTVFLLIVALAGLACATLVVFAGPIAALFGTPALAAILRWLSLSLLLQALAAVPLALLTRDMRFDAIAKRSLLMIACGGLVGVSLAMTGHGAWALVGQISAQSVVSAVLLFGSSSFRPRFRGSFEDARAIVGYASGVVGNRLVIQFDERAPQFVIGLFLGPAAVGLYNVAMRLVDVLIRIFVVPVNQVAMPGIAHVQNDPCRIRGILETGIGVASLISCPAFLGAAVVAPDLLPLALGDAWVPAVPVLQLLLLRGVLWPVVLYGAALLYGTGQPGRLLMLNAWDLAANAAVLAIAAPQGLIAVAVASSARILLVRWPLMGGAIARTTGISLRHQVRLMAPAIAAGGLMTLLLLAITQQLRPVLSEPATVVALVAIGMLAYPVLALALKPNLLGEIRTALRSLRTQTSDGGEGPLARSS